MSPSPNPFADDPLPDNVVRLQSAADPLDPYAAPPSVAEYREANSPGVGLWRDGTLLVIHPEATFPSRCLLTNEETKVRRLQSLTWSYPIDWSSRTVKLEYGVSISTQRHSNRTILIALTTAAVSFLLIVLLAYLPSEWNLVGSDFGGWVAFGCIAVIVGAIKIAWIATETLQFAKAKKGYLWLSGAKPAFLESLPPWPGVGGM